MQSFRRAQQALRTREVWDGAEQHEMHEIVNGRHVCHVGGSCYLMPVTAPACPVGSGPLTAGDRLSYGTLPIDPSAITGRLARFSRLFQENRVEFMRFEYRPSVAATEPGAIALAFTNDVYLDQQQVGLANFTTLSNQSGGFIQTQVFEPVSLHVKPELANQRYFDQDSGSTHFTATGLFTLLAASNLNTDAPTTERQYGNIFFTYEYTFYADTLPDEQELVNNATLTLTVNAGTTKPTGPGDLVAFPIAATSATGAGNPVIPSTGTIATADLPEYIFAGTVGGTQNVDSAWNMSSAEESGELAITWGQAFYFRFLYSADSGTTYAMPFLSWGEAQDAQLAIASGEAFSGYDLVWSDNLPWNNPSHVDLNGIFVPIGESI